MARYIFTGTIAVEGGEIRSKEDAITELQVMLGCYDDMNDRDSDVVIQWDSVRKDSANNS